jgi:hypothetical protein
VFTSVTSLGNLLESDYELFDVLDYFGYQTKANNKDDIEANNKDDIDNEVDGCKELCEDQALYIEHLRTRQAQTRLRGDAGSLKRSRQYEIEIDAVDCRRRSCRYPY